MAEINTILFDIYGTLIDIKTNEHRDEIYDSLSRFLEYRRVFISGKELKELYISEINQQFARSRERFPEIDVVQGFERTLKTHGKSYDRYLAILVAQFYRSLTREHFRLFSDTFWTLNEFRKRYRLGIVTDAQRAFSCPELRSLRIEEFFETVVISSDYGFRKPDPRLFHIALAAMNAKSEEAIYIGNKYETDLMGSKLANLALGILIHQSESDRETYLDDPVPDYVVADLSEAFKVISDLEL